MNMPIIRMDIEGMKHTIMVALTERQMQLDADIKAAVDAYCTPDNLAAVVQCAARAALDAVIKEEVTNFFRYGDGRHAVAAAVKEAILAKDTYTPIDDVN